MKEHLPVFLDHKKFGRPALFNEVTPIFVIFDDASKIYDPASGTMITSGPQAIARTSDVPEAFGKNLKVNGVVYKIIDPQEDGTGMTVLKLTKE